MIREDFLHYLWKYKYFAIDDLQTTSNLPLQIIDAGTHNLNAGPDFFNARLKIGNQSWAGNVEIHKKASDWYGHHHEYDGNYDNVILHVVWINDVEVYGSNDQLLPTLELCKIASMNQIRQYQKLFSKKLKWINCENQLNTVDQFTIDHWLEVLYIERLENKAKMITNLVEISSNDWEAVLFKLMARNFGLKVNGDAFLNLADSIDYKIIRKERTNLFQMESLLFGQSGFLDDHIENAYHEKLRNEYDYLKQKYKLGSLYKGQFSFFRLRPGNFPTIRIAQLALLYFSHAHLFSKIIKAKRLEDYYDLFTLKIMGYWQEHYSFTSRSLRRSKSLTKSFIDLVLINTVIPLKFVYLKQLGILNEEEILNLIRQIKPENNSIINKFKSLNTKDSNNNIVVNSAFESQALLQLKNNYCNPQKCLQCAIGNTLLKD